MKYLKKTFPRFTPGCIGMPGKKLRVSAACVGVQGIRPESAREGLCLPGIVWQLQEGGDSVQWQHFFSAGIIMDPDKDNQVNTPSLLEVLGSVLASMFGVQSNRRREQDFVHGKPSQYIVIGLLVTLVFILTVWGVVSLVMKLAGV
jgi:hypothetical protein